VEREEVKEEVEEGRRLSKTAALVLAGLAVGAPIATYLGYRYYLKTRPPVITSIGYAQSAPIVGTISRPWDLQLKRPVILFFYANVKDLKARAPTVHNMFKYMFKHISQNAEDNYHKG